MSSPGDQQPNRVRIKPVSSLVVRSLLVLTQEALLLHQEVCVGGMASSSSPLQSSWSAGRFPPHIG